MCPIAPSSTALSLAKAGAAALPVGLARAGRLPRRSPTHLAMAKKQGSERVALGKKSTEQGLGWRLDLGAPALGCPKAGCSALQATQ